MATRCTNERQHKRCSCEMEGCGGTKLLSHKRCPTSPIMNAGKRGSSHRGSIRTAHAIEESGGASMPHQNLCPPPPPPTPSSPPHIQWKCRKSGGGGNTSCKHVHQRPSILCGTAWCPRVGLGTRGWCCPATGLDIGQHPHIEPVICHAKYLTSRPSSTSTQQGLMWREMTSI